MLLIFYRNLYYALPAEVWSFILTYVSIIVLFNVCLRSKFFYACTHDKKRLGMKLRISKRIVTNYPVYGHFRGFVLSYYKDLSLKFEKNLF